MPLLLQSLRPFSAELNEDACFVSRLLAASIRRPCSIVLLRSGSHPTLSECTSSEERSSGRRTLIATGTLLSRDQSRCSLANNAHCSLYVIESGMLRASYLFLDQSYSICESMVAGTTAGEMSFLSRTKRNATVVAERDSVLWKLDVQSHEEMGRKEGWAFCRKFEQCLMRIAVEEQEGAFAFFLRVPRPY